MATIHALAVVDPSARLAEDVVVGPFCVVGAGVEIGAGTVLKSHVNVEGRTQIGAGCTVWPFASIGTQTQDLKFAGGSPGVRIGDGTTLREYVTVNAATADGVDTVVGRKCHIMAYAHVAHDCVVGDEVIMANAATLAGHVIVENQAIIGGLTGVHQFVRVGRLSITGGCAKVVQDVPPFMMADGNPLAIRGINKIGLERRGVPPETVRALKEVYRMIYRRKLGVKDAVQEMKAALPELPELTHLESFLLTSERGISR
ncbi:MAG: acyl-ACP--UDP-N-acetylglucosamine O-acyltransferase [Verrucomicrobia bacterium]|nr:acyl-ACP--UDP-N-acetylglucosamine O-acyltransferase [Verrucomicrobiota bacterium]MCH8528613.1 acyl-ACP--UDP-N-acetylglucosamine O-acyltransferase [Kiritimatiellia bacterium]